MSGNVYFREGVTYYRLPPPSRYIESLVPTWRDHASMNETIWRDFSDLTRLNRFQIGWDALEEAEFDLLNGAWDRIILGATIYFSDIDGTEHLVQYSPDTFLLTWEQFSGILQKPSTIGLGESSTMTTWGMLYLVDLSFRGTTNAVYVLP